MIGYDKVCNFNQQVPKRKGAKLGPNDDHPTSDLQKLQTRLFLGQVAASIFHIRISPMRTSHRIVLHKGLDCVEAGRRAC